MREGSP
jgi:hypothetical protein